MTREELLREVKRIVKRDKEPIYAVPEQILHLVDGDGDAAIFLAQALYWQEYSRKDDDGWWVKSKHELYQKLRFTRHKVDRIRARLSRYLDYKVAGCPPVCHYRLRLEVLLDDLCQLAGNRPIEKSETDQLKSRKPTNQLVGNAPLVGVKPTNQLVGNRPIQTSTTQPQIAAGTDSFKREEIYTEQIQTPTPRCAASLERLSSSNGGGASADSHIHISSEDLALLAQRYGIRFAKPPSPWACVMIRNVLSGEGSEAQIAVLRTLAARGSGDFGGAVAAAPREANTTVGG